MQEELRRLGGLLCRPVDWGAAIPAAEAAGAAAAAVVALPAGGFGYRMRGADPPGGVTQKALLPLPNGETLVGRLVRQYAAAGMRRFVALLNHEGEAVAAHLGDGSRWGVEIAVSYDPDPRGSGRTGALLHAMEAGLLPEGRLVVVHNADCHLMRYRGCFPLDLLRAHLGAAAARPVTATLAAVDGSPYAYTGMQVEGGMVAAVEMYPFIPVPTHTGITLLTPAALAEIRENAGRSRKNFEQDLFPRWAAAGRLAALVIPSAHWIAVDDRKGYRIFTEAVAAGG